MTDNPYTVELVIRGDLDTLRGILDQLDPAPRVDVDALRARAAEPARCGEQHPHYGWTCALPEGHDGKHDPEPHLPLPKTSGEVEDAPAMQAPEHRGEAVERPASPGSDGAGSSSSSGPASPPDTGGEDVPPVVLPAGPASVSRSQLRMMFATFGSLGYTDEELGGREARLRAVSDIVGRDVESTSDLTKDEAKAVIDTLARCKTREDVENVQAAYVEHREGR